MKEIVIVGAGFSGAYIARNLAKDGWKVHILEKRNHIGGNMFDYIDEDTGCLVQKYGPHIFHTSDEKINNWLTQFTKPEKFFLETRVYMENQFLRCPFSWHTIDQVYSEEKADKIKSSLLSEFPNKDSITIPELLSAKSPEITEFANFLWENDYKLYTAKQWGLDPKEVDPSVLSRVPFYNNYQRGVHAKEKYEWLPKGGYTKMFRNILTHKNITVELGVDAIKCLQIIDDEIYYNGNPTIVLYTGALDELFEYRFGRLGYRGLEFKFKKTENSGKNIRNDGAPCVDVFPGEEYEYTRITNYGLLPIQKNLENQISAIEYPYEYTGEQGQERYYPITTEENKERYDKYLKCANEVKNLYVAGRLADFKYYNMDQALINADKVLSKIKRDFDKKLKVYTVTGANGYIGSYFVEQLSSMENTLVYSVIRKGSTPKVIRENIIPVEFDFTTSSLEHAIANSEHIIHLGALYTTKETDKDIIDLVNNNILFSSILFSIAKKYKGKIISVASTFSGLDENGEYKGSTFYAATKNAVETIAEYYRDDMRINFFRFPETYGPNDTRPKIHNILQKKEDSEDFVMNSSSLQPLRYMHVMDILNHILLNCDSGNGLYFYDLFEYAEEIRLKELVEIIGAKNVKFSEDAEIKSIPKSSEKSSPSKVNDREFSILKWYN